MRSRYEPSRLLAAERIDIQGSQVIGKIRGIEWDLGPTYTTHPYQLPSNGELRLPSRFGATMRSRTQRTSEVVCVTECSDGWHFRQ